MAKVLGVLRGRRQTRRFQRSVYLLPGMFTVGNLFCGYACIVYAMRADYVPAAVFIGVATLLDLLDGRIARLAGAASEFGGEFDSLADVISFGVAPAVLAFAWGLEPLGRLGWAVGFLYVTATALRLARFNVQTANPDKRYFRRDAEPRRCGGGRLDRLRLAGRVRGPAGADPRAGHRPRAGAHDGQPVAVSQLRRFDATAGPFLPRAAPVRLPHRSDRRPAGGGTLHHGPTAISPQDRSGTWSDD